MGKKLFIIFFITFAIFTHPVNADSGCLNGELGNINCSSDGKIDTEDLNILLNNWTTLGPIPTPIPLQISSDLNNDNKIDEIDLNILLKNWNGEAMPTPTKPSSTNTPIPGANTPTPIINPTMPPPIGSKDYNPPAPINYNFYDWRGDDFNTQYPSGAPWGGVFVVPWMQIHVGPGEYNWQPIDDYLTRSAAVNKPIILKLNVFESDIPGKNSVPSSYTCPAGSNQSVFPLFFDLTPQWIIDRIGRYYIPMNGQNGIQLCRQGGDNPDPRYCWAVASMPKYDDGLYQSALKDLIFAMGARYNNDSRVAGIIFGQGLDDEFGNVVKGWGDCDINQAAAKLGYSRNYASTFVKAGPNNDYTDWYATAFSNKAVYHTVTSDIGKGSIATMMAQGYPNLGIHQASLAPDHNWFMTNGNDGILQIVMPWVGVRPISWEDAVPPLRDTDKWTKKQQAYAVMFPALITFPDFFDFTGGMCFDPVYMESCNWAKQYYGRTPKDTNEVWIAFQQTDFPGSGGTMNFAGWTRDWEYGLDLTSQKGTTIWRKTYASSVGPNHSAPGLLELFNQSVADGYTGQARKLDLNQIMTLSPNSQWKGDDAGSSGNYDLSIIFVDNTGKVKVEVGNDADGWFTQEWDRTNTVSWQTKTLNVNKKASTIKITPISGDALYMHMVKLLIK